MSRYVKYEFLPAFYLDKESSPFSRGHYHYDNPYTILKPCILCCPLP